MREAACGQAGLSIGVGLEGATHLAIRNARKAHDIRPTIHRLNARRTSLSFLDRFRVASSMLFDLKPQELMYGFQGLGGCPLFTSGNLRRFIMLRAVDWQPHCRSLYQTPIAA